MLQTLTDWFQKKPLAVLILLFLSLRVSLMLLHIEALFWEEELYRGMMAQEILQGLDKPLWDYQPDPYSGGSLIVAALATPLFYLFGANLFALKLVPLLFSLSTLILLYSFLKRFWGENTAKWGGLCWIFAPPVVIKLFSVAMGFHSESVLLVLGFLFYFYRYLFDSESSVLSILSAGVLAGLSCWFTLSALVWVITAFAAWPIMNRSRFTKEAVILSGAGFLIGISPLLAYNLTHQGSGAAFLIGSFEGEYSLANRLIQTPVEMARLLVRTLPFSFGFEPLWNIPGYILSSIYYLLLLSGILLSSMSFPRRRESDPCIRMDDAKLLPFFLYPFIFFLIYGLSNYQSFFSIANHFPNYRVFASIYFCLIVLTAASLSDRRWLKPVMIATLLIGVVGQAQLFSIETPTNAFKQPGYSYDVYSESNDE